jgi:hypothetical protein
MLTNVLTQCPTLSKHVRMHGPSIVNNIAFIYVRLHSVTHAPFFHSLHEVHIPFCSFFVAYSRLFVSFLFSVENDWKDQGLNWIYKNFNTIRFVSSFFRLSDKFQIMLCAYRRLVKFWFKHDFVIYKNEIYIGSIIKHTHERMVFEYERRNAPCWCLTLHIQKNILKSILFSPLQLLITWRRRKIGSTSNMRIDENLFSKKIGKLLFRLNAQKIRRCDNGCNSFFAVTLNSRGNEHTYTCVFFSVTGEFNLMMCW